MNIPNILTFIRILMIPILIIIYSLPIPSAHISAAVVFGCAALTDWLDGFLARNLKQGTRFGAFLDPVADKLIVVVALVLVVGQIGSIYITIPAAVIIGREIVVSGLREWMAQIGQRERVAVNFIAKIKTFVQMIALILLLLYTPQSGLGLKLLTLFLLYIAATLTLWSMLKYLKMAWQDLTLSTNK